MAPERSRLVECAKGIVVSAGTGEAESLVLERIKEERWIVGRAGPFNRLRGMIGGFTRGADPIERSGTRARPNERIPPARSSA